MKQFTVFVEDNFTAFTDFLNTLSKHDVKVQVFTTTKYYGKDVVKLVTNDEIKLRNYLKDYKFNFEEKYMFVTELLDRPGMLVEKAQEMSKQGLNIDTLYFLDKYDDKQIIAFEVSNFKMKDAQASNTKELRFNETLA